MRIVEDIVRIKKEDPSERDGEAKKNAAFLRFKNETPVKKTEEKARNLPQSSAERLWLSEKFFNNKRLYFIAIAILSAFIILGLFLYNNDKDTPTFIKNIADELEKENEFLEKEISELEKFNSEDALEDINQRIEEMSE